MTMTKSTGPSSPSIGAPVFLVGTTRSGTTLLSLILGSHPDIVSVGEFEWLWDFAPDAAEPSLEKYYAWLATHRHFLFHGLRLDRSLGFEDQVRSFLAQMRCEVDPHADRQIVVCQMHRHYRRVFDLWPHARFIHIVRDGRDVCASWIKLAWLGNGYEAGMRWKEALDEWAALRQCIDPTRHLELRFEDLVTSPEQELARLCEFLATPYSDAMLQYHRDSTYGPVDPAQASKWKLQLFSADLRMFEAVACAELEANGYALSGEPVHPLRPWSRPLLLMQGRLRHHYGRAGIYGPRLWLSDILSRWIGPESWRNRVRLALNSVENARLK